MNIMEYYNNTSSVNIFIKMTDDCNLSCTFCYQKATQKREYLNIDSDKFIDNLSALLNRINDVSYTSMVRTSATITFFGGEPTLCVPEMSRLFAKIERMKEEYSYNFDIKYSITTNGVMLLDEGFNDFVRNIYNVTGNRLSLLVSCDTDEKSEEKNRGKIDVMNKITEFKKRFPHNIIQTNTVLSDDFDIEHYDPKKLLQNNITTRLSPLYINTKKELEEATESGMLEKNIKKLIEHYTSILHNENLNKDRKITILASDFFRCKLNGANNCNFNATINPSGDISWCNSFDDISNYTQEDKVNKFLNGYEYPITESPCPKAHLVNDPENWKDITGYNMYIYRMFHEHFSMDYGKASGGIPVYSEVNCRNLEILFSVGLPSKSFRVFKPEAGVMYIDGKGDIYMDYELRGKKEYVVSNIFDYYFLIFDREIFMKSLEFIMERAHGKN